MVNKGVVLYACSSYYQLLVTLQKACVSEQTVDLFLEEHGIETAKELAEKLSGRDDLYVRNVYVCPNHPDVYPYRDYLLMADEEKCKSLVSYVEDILGGSDVREYDEVNVFWDLGYMGTYLNICHIPYILHEDSLNSYTHIRGVRTNYEYIFDREGYEYRRRKEKREGVIPFGFSDECKAVEVNSLDGIEIDAPEVLEKFRAVPRKEIEDRLTDEKKKQIYHLFFGDEEKCADDSQSDKSNAPSNRTSPPKRLLLLTEPFAKTGRLESEEQQLLLYKKIVKEYSEAFSDEQSATELVIKAHPRDTFDYKEAFPDATVLEKNVPMEVMNYDDSVRFDRAVTVTSSVIQNIKNADEKILLGREYLVNFIKANKQDE